MLQPLFKGRAFELQEVSKMEYLLVLLNFLLISPTFCTFPFNSPPTREGIPLPLPVKWSLSNNVYEVKSRSFSFNATTNTCDDLEAAFDRYYRMIFDVPEAMGRKKIKLDFQQQKLWQSKLEHIRAQKSSSQIGQLEVNVAQPCDGAPKPALGMSESYKLMITGGRAMLNADTLWGALRGLETFSQLVYETEFESHDLWLLNETMVEDEPRFTHRGFMLDSSRHFLEKNIILQFISAMAMAKFNVFHWHIVDSQSFPYRSRVFPDLSKYGAYEPYTHTYDHEDIKEVIEFSRQRGIRVVVEFDTPGHTLAWGKGQPGLLTPCYGADGNPDGTFGPVDPSKNGTYEFLAQLFKEVTTLFPDKYIHLGGDEVSFNCWKSNPDINEFMTKVGIKPGDYSGLESYYIKRVVDLVGNLGDNYIVWQEPFDNGVKLNPATVVNVWKRSPDMYKELQSVTSSGFKAILSTCWYLNRIAYGENWQSYYTCDPQKFNGTDAQKALVMGGEGCMWGEWVDGTNLMARTWPRAAVVAERLWSPKTATDMTSMKARLEVHRCRMIKRGLDADPLDPSYCRYEKQAEPPKY